MLSSNANYKSQNPVIKNHLEKSRKLITELAAIAKRVSQIKAELKVLRAENEVLAPEKDRHLIAKYLPAAKALTAPTKPVVAVAAKATPNELRDQYRKLTGTAKSEFYNLNKTAISFAKKL